MSSDKGMRVRREVLGDEHVDAAIERATDFTREFQDLITRYAWGEIWARPGLDRRTRLRNGLTPDEIKEVLLHSAIYCGVPAANTAFSIAEEALAET